jgi:pyrroline-5-carboxylate reductase
VNVTFIGGGNMASALIGGMIGRGAHATDFRVVDPQPAQRDRLAKLFAGMTILDRTSADAVAGARVVVLAVKPQQMHQAARALAAHVASVPVVLSIAAGIRTGDLARWLGGYRRIVRAMPNTPALVGAGISGLYATAEVGAEARETAAAILEVGGEILWCDDERLLDAITGVSGSGPAYVFYFLEALEQAGCELGLAPNVARTLAYATFAGAVALARQSSDEPAVLRAKVTSKGGTTARALEVLEAAGVKAQFVAAVKAAAARADELGRQFGAEA